MSEIFLRALQLTDLEATQKWHGDEDLYRTLAGPFRFVSLEAEQEWLQSKTRYSNQEVNMAICLAETRQPIGLISVREIDWISRRGHFTGLFIGDSEFHGKGFGTEALNLLLHHCFCDLGLNRIFGYALEDNEASLKMVQKCGFKIEGILKQHIFKDGVFIDAAIFGLCADEYFKIQDSRSKQ